MKGPFWFARRIELACERAGIAVIHCSHTETESERHRRLEVHGNVARFVKRIESAHKKAARGRLQFDGRVV